MRVSMAVNKEWLRDRSSFPYYSLQRPRFSTPMARGGDGARRNGELRGVSWENARETLHGHFIGWRRIVHRAARRTLLLGRQWICRPRKSLCCTRSSLAGPRKERFVFWSRRRACPRTKGTCICSTLDLRGLSMLTRWFLSTQIRGMGAAVEFAPVKLYRSNLSRARVALAKLGVIYVYIKQKVFDFRGWRSNYRRMRLWKKSYSCY